MANSCLGLTFVLVCVGLTVMG